MTGMLPNRLGALRRGRVWVSMVAAVATASAIFVPTLSASAAPTAGAHGHAALHAGYRGHGGGQGRGARLVEMSAIPAARGGHGTARSTRALPVGTGQSPAHYAALKAAARTAASAPRPAQPGHLSPSAASSKQLMPQTPSASKVFSGQSDSATTCPYFGGCAPPDEALAASKSYVVQLVNTSIAVYSTSGVIKTGFPKNLQTFFGVPAPSPSGCDPNGPFLSDPRAAYDSNSGRFYASVMQIEGGLGVGTGCTASSTVWFAISKTSNPTGGWYVYSLAVPTTSASVFSDYTQFGFDTQGLYWSFNLFNSAGSALVGNVVFGVRKAQLLTGAGFSYWYFSGLNVSGTILDTIHPAESLAHNAGPQGEIFIGSYNINSGGGNCSSGCSGLIVWDFDNIAFSGSSNPGLSGLVIASDSYSLAPLADDPPTCNACVETLDTRVSGTPMYQHGQVYAGLDTAVNNGSGANVPGLLWFDVNIYLNAGTSTCPQCTTINSSTGMQQQGYYYYSAARDAFFPTLIPDSEGNLCMGYEYSSSTDSVDPSQVYVCRRVTLPPGTMSDNGKFAIESTTASTQERQGDYGDSSWPGTANDSTWSAGEYSCPTTGDWCTAIWHIAWTISSN